MAIEVRKRPYRYCFSGNPVHYELYSNLSAVDVSVFIEVRVMYKPITGSYEATEPIPYSPTDGICTLDIRDILEGLLEYTVPDLSLPELAMQLAPRQTGMFYLQWREITALNPDPTWDNSEAAHACFVVFGGLSTFKFQGNNFWVNYFQPKRPFLTWRQNNRLAYVDERMYLLWLNIDDLSGKDLVIRAAAHYTDGTITLVDQPADGVEQGAAYYVPAGARQWGLQALNPAKKLYRWSIAVFDNSTGVPVPVSEEYFFRVNYRNDYNRLYLNYRGSLGGLDSFAVAGVIQHDEEYTFMEQSRTVQPNYYAGHYFDPQRIIASSTEQLIWKGNIGLLEKEEQDRLRDSHLKREVWMAVDGKWWPIVLTTKSQTLRKSTDGRWSFPIEFSLAVEHERFYTPMSVELGAGVFNDNVCLAIPVNVMLMQGQYEDYDEFNFSLAINDPQGAAQKYRWRVVGWVDWTDAQIGQGFSFQLPKDTTAMLEVQAICNNDVPGRLVQRELKSTATAPDPGGGDPPPPPPMGNTLIENRTGSFTYFTIEMSNGSGDWDYVGGGSIGAYSDLDITIPDFEARKLRISFSSISPSYVVLTANGMNHYASMINGGQVEIGPFTLTYMGTKHVIRIE